MCGSERNHDNQTEYKILRFSGKVLIHNMNFLCEKIVFVILGDV